jgi:hypothetical protein
MLGSEGYFPKQKSENAVLTQQNNLICTLKTLKNHPDYSKRWRYLYPYLRYIIPVIPYLPRILGHFRMLECTSCSLQGDHASHMISKVPRNPRSFVWDLGAVEGCATDSFVTQKSAFTSNTLATALCGWSILARRS